MEPRACSFLQAPLPREGPPPGQPLDYYRFCDKLSYAMNFHDLKSGRLAKGLSQVQAATRLGVSQPYLAMLESGRRRLTPKLARRAMKVYDLSPTVLPPSESLSRHRVDAKTLANDLARSEERRVGKECRL